MELEDRYVVYKLKDLKEVHDGLRVVLYMVDKFTAEARTARGANPNLQCLVIEKDWPEYETVLKMLSDRVDAEKRAK